MSLPTWDQWSWSDLNATWIQLELSTKIVLIFHKHELYLDQYINRKMGNLLFVGNGGELHYNSSVTLWQRCVWVAAQLSRELYDNSNTTLLQRCIWVVLQLSKLWLQLLKGVVWQLNYNVMATLYLSCWTTVKRVVWQLRYNSLDSSVATQIQRS